MELSQASGRAVLGIETWVKKQPSVSNPSSRSPLQNLALPTAFYLKSRLKTACYFGEGWDSQSPVRHPAPCLTQDILVDTCFNTQCKHEAISAFTAMETPKGWEPLAKPSLQSQPCPEPRLCSSQRLHTNLAAGIIPTAAKLSLKAGCLAELLFPQINTHNLTQNREAPLWEYSSCHIPKNPALSFPPLLQELFRAGQNLGKGATERALQGTHRAFQ